MFTETTATSSSSSSSSSTTTHPIITITCEDSEDKQLQMDNSTLINTSTNDSEPPAYSQLSVTAPPPVARVPAQNPYADMLPTYEHAKVDMPPSYPIPKYADSPFDAPIEPQEPWPLTKKLYIAGFVFWPLWFVGMGFCVFGRQETTRLWGKRCAYNSLIVVAVFTYIIVAFFRTGGHIF